MLQTELIEACRKNDRKAQMKLYNKYCDAMYYVAFRFLKNSFEAEEAMQESFIQAFLKRLQFVFRQGNLKLNDHIMYKKYELLMNVLQLWLVHNLHDFGCF